MNFIEEDIIDYCLGKELGTKLMQIPSDNVNAGLWKLEAVSKNYILNGKTPKIYQKGDRVSFSNFQFDGRTFFRL